MAKFIIKLEDRKRQITRFIEWSTVVDAGISKLFTSIEEVRSYLINEYGFNVQDIKDRIDILSSTGSSTPFYSLQDCLDCNQYKIKTEEKLIKFYEQPN